MRTLVAQRHRFEPVSTRLLRATFNVILLLFLNDVGSFRASFYMTSTNKRAPCNIIFKDKIAARLSNGRFVGKGKKKRTAALLSSKRMSSHKENENR